VSPTKIGHRARDLIVRRAIDSVANQMFRRRS
jgi:hypothetical protein